MRIRIIKAKTMTQQKKKRVAAYVRVSTDSMEQEGSLVNQSTYYESFLGSNPDYEFMGIYSDQGISGYEERRPGFQKMIEDARDGKIELIYVKSVSRFARNTEIVLKYSRELKQYGVGIYFELQNIIQPAWQSEESTQREKLALQQPKPTGSSQTNMTASGCFGIRQQLFAKCMIWLIRG